MSCKNRKRCAEGGKLKANAKLYAADEKNREATMAAVRIAL